MTGGASDATEPIAASEPIELSELARRPSSSLNGVGPKRGDALEAMGLTSTLDLLTHYPRRYLDRTREARIAELAVGEEATVLARVRRVEQRPIGGKGRGRRTMVTIDVGDDSGSMRLTFFNQPWRAKQLSVGQEVIVFGKLEDFRGSRQMTNPVVDLVGDRTGRILPVYPQSERAGLSTWEIGDLVAQVLRRTRRRGLADPVPDGVRSRLGLIGRDPAFHQIHEPTSMNEVSEARRRLVFDELLRIQVALVRRKRELERDEVGITHRAGRLVEQFLAGLPYELTAAQRRTIDEIRTDLEGNHPMHRLLQGDVGAGKTVVAVAAILCGIDGGYQGALMAPTEVLADQHARSVRDLLDELRLVDDSSLFGERGVTVELLTNRTSAGERRRILEGLASGAVELLIGTHSLIQEGVDFSRLGVVVIDEQHRFGVEQRAVLRKANPDGSVPDVLVMTATPIPRTAAMTVYGDLDVSVLDELPPGRTPINTHWVRSEAEEEAMWDRVRAEVDLGRQAYVVCPLVDESEKLEIASATETYERLAAGELAGMRVGLLHGRMTSVDKDVVMTEFRDGRLDVLVATTVIEVGVDVPNATVMVILDADRFGIAQLHQLRGRVGRGAEAS
ncbi:MAG TPA: ATP-dependent DNA helicase RecG, partial [Microthrixaceae bacterium]|nr:ATP-dependent DNA helicase RecG [Microthrixaceae bacterium]